MSLSLGMKAEIRSLIFVASEPLPLFWPMRTFIHHNPLQGLEKLKFEDAITEGERLFHGKGFLHRNSYQAYYQEGIISHQSLTEFVEIFLGQHEPLQIKRQQADGQQTKCDQIGKIEKMKKEGGKKAAE